MREREKEKESESGQKKQFLCQSLLSVASIIATSCKMAWHAWLIYFVAIVCRVVTDAILVTVAPTTLQLSPCFILWSGIRD